MQFLRLKIYNKIKNVHNLQVNIQFPNNLSKESINFMQNLLMKNPLSRISLEDALNH